MSTALLKKNCTDVPGRDNYVPVKPAIPEIRPYTVALGREKLKNAADIATVDEALDDIGIDKDLVKRYAYLADKMGLLAVFACGKFGEDMDLEYKLLCEEFIFSKSQG